MARTEAENLKKDILLGRTESVGEIKVKMGFVVDAVDEAQDCDNWRAIIEAIRSHTTENLQYWI